MKALAGLLLLSASLMAAEPVPVTVQSLGQLWLPQQHNAPARVLSLNKPAISAEISASVTGTPVNVGDVVAEGDVLVQLDCENYQLQQQVSESGLARSKAQLSFARSQLSRANNLKKKKSISEELLDQRRTELQVALADKALQEQNLALAMMKVEDCQVVAPFAAVVTERMVSRGDYANTGQALISLVDLTAIEVEAELNHAEIASLSEAGKIVFEHETTDFMVALKTIVQVFDYQSATARVRLVFSNNQQPWPGSEGRLKWQSKQMLLPADYISRRNQQLGVFHVIDAKAEFVLLEKAIEGRPVAVELPANAQVVVEGRHSLNAGDAVRIISQD